MNYQAPLYAFLFCLGLVALLIKPARFLNWVDQPGHRKHHRDPVPLIGGVAMCIAICLSASLLSQKPHAWLTLLTGLILMTGIGVYDDLCPVKPSVRLLFQIGAALLMVVSGDVVLNNLGNLLGLGVIALHGSAVFFTLFSVVGVINALNMSDGIDGLAGGLALIAFGWLTILSLAVAGDPRDTTMLLVLAAAVAGFLFYNLRHPWRMRASVFMGDAGSTMLGFALGWFMIRLSQGDHAVMTPMTAVLILALPLLDTVTVMIRRIRVGHSPFRADRQHLHHLLLNNGWTDGWVTALLLAVAAATGAVAVVANWLRLPDYLQFYGFVGAFFLYYHATTRCWARQQARLTPVSTARATDPIRLKHPLKKHPVPDRPLQFARIPSLRRIRPTYSGYQQVASDGFRQAVGNTLALADGPEVDIGWCPQDQHEARAKLGLEASPDA